MQLLWKHLDSCITLVGISYVLPTDLYMHALQFGGSHLFKGYSSLFSSDLVGLSMFSGLSLPIKNCLLITCLIRLSFILDGGCRHKNQFIFWIIALSGLTRLFVCVILYFKVVC